MARSSGSSQIGWSDPHRGEGLLPVFTLYKVKRSFLLGRKVMTNQDSILKSRNITLPTKVHLVKDMVFPVVMYGCESWTIKLNAKEMIFFLLVGGYLL